MTLHWDGTQWSRITSPSPGNLLDELLDVQVVSSKDVWAVGYTHSNGGPWLTLTEHWNGTQWSIVPSPNPGQTQTYLRRVSAVAHNDVWAAGYYLNPQGYSRTLIEHWDGVQWNLVSSPNENSNNNELWDIGGISANDVWAVGNYSGGGPTFTLIEHWNGVQWNLINSPNPADAYGVVLHGVSIVSSTDVWAVGDWSNEMEASTVVEHWDGMEWSIVPSPNSDSGDNHF